MRVCCLRWRCQCTVLLLFTELHTELKLSSSVIIREEREGLEAKRKKKERAKESMQGNEAAEHGLLPLCITG